MFTVFARLFAVVKRHFSVLRFFFDKTGAKKKLTKRNAEKGISHVVTGDKGYAPLTAPPFEKGGRKLPT